MTLRLREDKAFIDSLSVDPTIHEAALSYSAVLQVVATSIHGLNRQLYLADNPPKVQLTMNDVIHQMKRNGVTVESLREMLERQRVARGGGIKNEKS